MLVLSRRRGEKIVINDGEITVMVIEVRGDTVRIGIDAPDDMPVHREEVFNAISNPSLHPYPSPHDS